MRLPYVLPMLGLSLVAASAANAQEGRYHVTGPSGLVGHAEVAKTARADTFTVELTTEPRGGEAQTIRVDDARWDAAAGRLGWVREVRASSGASGWLESIFNGGDADDGGQCVEASLALGADGALRGDVEGSAQRWVSLAPLESTIVLAVPGLSTNAWNKVGIPYLDENVRALQAAGVPARRLEISTENGVEANAAYIAGQIRAEAARGNKVVVMAHSKGATDTTAALALEPALAQHVVGVIAIQPVYAGSPIADFVANRWMLRRVVKAAFERAFGGQGAAVTDLSHASRSAFIEAHPYPAATVPTIVVRSTFNRRFGSKSVLWTNQKAIAHYAGDASDGMVTLADQVIPGAAETIDFEDLDHFEPGVRVESKHTPTEITRRALDALLRHLPK